MTIDGRTRLIGLVGHGISHTLSPRIQNRALASLGENAVYVPFDIEEEDLAGLIHLFPRIGGIGLNVTTPHKGAAGRLVRAGETEVVHTGTVNTITWRDGSAVGFSTDGRGFRSWMDAQGVRSGPGGVVLLGFGAVARSLAYILAQEFPLTIVSRTPENAAALLDSWVAKGWAGLPTRTRSWTDPPPSQAVLVVGGLPPDFARSPEVATWLARCDPAGIVVDLNYGQGRTPLRDQARDRGLAAFDGLGHLVHQGALSLSIWLGRSVRASLLEDGLAEGTQ
jgi:shikimate dehydrogenase